MTRRKRQKAKNKKQRAKDKEQMAIYNGKSKIMIIPGA